jgi:hypothetical protein
MRYAIRPNGCPSPPKKWSELGRRQLKSLRSWSKASVPYLFNITSHLVSLLWRLVLSQCFTVAMLSCYALSVPVLFHFILSHSRHKADSTLLTFCLPSIWIYTLRQYVLLWLIRIYSPQFELSFYIKLVCQCCLR